MYEFRLQNFWRMIYEWGEEKQEREGEKEKFRESERKKANNILGFGNQSMCVHPGKCFIPILVRLSFTLKYFIIDN